MPKRVKLEAGAEYASWTVLFDLGSQVGTDGKRNGYAMCLCVCGTVKEIKNGQLTSGSTGSCGCVKSPQRPADEAAKREIAVEMCRKAAARHPTQALL